MCKGVICEESGWKYSWFCIKKNSEKSLRVSQKFNFWLMQHSQKNKLFLQICTNC